VRARKGYIIGIRRILPQLAAESLFKDLMSHRVLQRAVMIVFLASLAAGQASAPAEVLTLTGTLTVGVMAVGGETTRITLTVDRITYELDIKDPALRKVAEGLNGKAVTVKGALTIQLGVEVRQRLIILVSSLGPASPTTVPASAPASRNQ
jgi:hypothetical protein